MRDPKHSRLIGLRTVFRKEVVENLRDRRAVFNSLLLGPLLFPVLIIGMAFLSVSTEEERAEKTLEIPVNGAEHASSLVTYLEQEGVVVLPAIDEPEQQVRLQNVDAVIQIPADYGDYWRSGRPAPVELISDPSRPDSRIAMHRLRGHLYGFGYQIGTLRLQLRGVSPGLSPALVIKDVDVSTPKSRAILVLIFLPYVLMLTAFIGGMHIAIDITAGEKERGSLEPLLINPVPRWQIMTAKVLATATYGLASLALTILSFKLSVPYMPIDRLGIDLELSTLVAAKILLVLSPVALVAAALLTLLAAFAKSFREAQSYMGLVTLVPIIPSLMFMTNPPKPETWVMPIPLFSQSILIGEFVRGQPVEQLWLLLSSAGTLALGLFLAAIAATLYNRSRVIFPGA